MPLTKSDRAGFGKRAWWAGQGPSCVGTVTDEPEAEAKKAFSVRAPTSSCGVERVNVKKLDKFRHEQSPQELVKASARTA